MLRLMLLLGLGLAVLAVNAQFSSNYRSFNNPQTNQRRYVGQQRTQQYQQPRQNQPIRYQRPVQSNYPVHGGAQYNGQRSLGYQRQPPRYSVQNGQQRGNVRPQQHRPSGTGRSTIRQSPVQKHPVQMDMAVMKHKTHQRKKSKTTQAEGRSKVHPSRVPRFKKYFQPLTPEQLQGRGSAAAQHDHHHGEHDLIFGYLGHHDHKSEAAMNDHAAIMAQMDNSMMGQVRDADMTNCDPTPNVDIDGKNYLATGDKPGCPPMTWSEAADFCQSKAMSLVSLSKSVDPITAKDILDIPKKLGDGNTTGFWTGGYVMHPDDPRVSNSVVWSTVSREAEIIRPGEGYFSATGEIGEAQPDNWEYVASGSNDPSMEEHCVAVLNNKYDDGQKLHDLRCNVRLPVVCEEVNFEAMDSKMMMI